MYLKSLKGILTVGFIEVVMLGLILITPSSSVDNCAGIDGSPDDVTPAQDSYPTLVCCYSGSNQQYHKYVRGINYDHYYAYPCINSAPCESVMIEVTYGNHVAKFAWCLDAYPSGGCPGQPATRCKT